MAMLFCQMWWKFHSSLWRLLPDCREFESRFRTSYRWYQFGRICYWPQVHLDRKCMANLLSYPILIFWTICSSLGLISAQPSTRRLTNLSPKCSTFGNGTCCWAWRLWVAAGPLPSFFESWLCSCRNCCTRRANYR